MSAVVGNETQILPHIFPEGTSPAAIGKVIDHEANFSVREIPVPIQFPDWNTWLPDLAPEDMWPTAFYYDQPHALYNALRDTLATQGVAALTGAGQLNATFADFNIDLRNWYGGDFRLVDKDPANMTGFDAFGATVSKALENRHLGDLCALLQK